MHLKHQGLLLTYSSTHPLTLLLSGAAVSTVKAWCRHTAWIPWLQAAASIEDCKLSSHAGRALLHLDSARAFPTKSTYQFDHNLYEPEMLQR